MSNKKTIRLTESEMVSLIENIVNKVKKEKRNKINESKKKSKHQLLRESGIRLLMEAEEEEIAKDIETVEAGGEQDGPIKDLLEKIEQKIEDKKVDAQRLIKRFGRKIKKFMNHLKRSGKFPQRFRKLETACQNFS